MTRPNTALGVFLIHPDAWIKPETPVYNVLLNLDKRAEAFKRF